MLDRLSKRRQGSEVHPHEWEIRQSSLKRLRSRSSNDFPSVPSSLIFKDVAIPYSLTSNSTAPPTFEQYPAPGHVAAHLLLVECFHKLRLEVESSPMLDLDLQARNRRFNIKLSPSKSSTWTSYLSLAIQRFRLWITKIESVIRHSAVFNRYGTGSHLHGAFTENYLPPLDVLLIWYSYLQSPASYERLVASNDFKLLSQICFPWHIIPTAIDQDTLDYDITPAARALWNNQIEIPFELEDCMDEDFHNESVAFMSAPGELLDIALRQSELIEEFHQYQWLRSPALRGTIERAMSRYTNRVMHLSTSDAESTQQVPIDRVEPRSTQELDLDLPSQLILHTHRAYHSAWQIFAQLNNLKDEEIPPPPTYDESNTPAPRYQATEKKDLPDTGSCYCWICERIKDESGFYEDSTMVLSPLSQVSSPDDEKRTISSQESSSDSENSFPALDLTQKQIKAIKADVAVFRHVENLRVKRLAR